MNNTITKTDDQVNNSNEVITQEQRVDNVLNSEIQKIKDLKVRLKENDQWSVKNFDGIECNFFDYLNDGKFSRNQIESVFEVNFQEREVFFFVVFQKKSQRVCDHFNASWASYPVVFFPELVGYLVLSSDTKTLSNKTS